MGKAQVSVFLVVVALIIVIGVGAFLFLRASPSPSSAPAATLTASPVGDYVQQCLQSVTQAGITRMEDLGGYTDTSGIKLVPMQSTESEGVELVPGSNLAIPYWYYMASPNSCQGDCTFGSFQRPLCTSGCPYAGQGSMEQELGSYIDAHLGACLGDFSSFSKQGITVRPAGAMNATAMITQGGVQVHLTYPLQVTESNTTTTVSSFDTAVDSVLYQLYTAAAELTEYERTNCTLENAFMNDLSYYTGVGGEFPPISATSTAKQTWNLATLKQKIGPVTASALSLIRLYNTSVQVWSNTSNTFQDAINNQFVYAPFGHYIDAVVSLQYFPWFKPYLSVKPASANGVIAPSEEGVTLPGALQQFFPAPRYSYEASYMYSFPALVEIHMLNNRTNAVESFRFALEANIRNNQCFRKGSSYSFQPDPGQTLLCDADFRGSRTYLIKVSDDRTGEPLANASVSFYAGSECAIGTTDANGTLATTLPLAESGLVIVKKDGYLSQRAVATMDQGSPYVFVKLPPLYDEEVQVRVINATLLNRILSTGDLSLRDTAPLLEPSEGYLLTGTVTRIGEQTDGDLAGNLLLSDTDTLANLSLTKGTYAIDLQLIDRNNLSLPAEHDRLCTAGTGLGSCVKTPVSDSCLLRGGSKADYQNGDCYQEGYTCEDRCDSIEANIKADGVIAAMGADAFRNRVLTELHLRMTPDQITAWYQTFLHPADASAACGFWLTGGTTKLCSVDQEITYPAVNMSSFPDGGLNLPENGTAWTVPSYQQLQGHPHLTVYIYQMPTPWRFYQLQELTQYMNITQDHAAVFMPSLD